MENFSLISKQLKRKIEKSEPRDDEYEYNDNTAINRYLLIEFTSGISSFVLQETDNWPGYLSCWLQKTLSSTAKKGAENKKKSYKMLRKLFKNGKLQHLILFSLQSTPNLQNLKSNWQN